MSTNTILYDRNYTGILRLPGASPDIYKFDSKSLSDLPEPKTITFPQGGPLSLVSVEIARPIQLGGCDASMLRPGQWSKLSVKTFDGSAVMDLVPDSSADPAEYPKAMYDINAENNLIFSTDGTFAWSNAKTADDDTVDVYGQGRTRLEQILAQSMRLLGDGARRFGA